MQYKHKLTPTLIEKALLLTEFANGGAQVTIKLNDGRIFTKALISNATAIIAMRGYRDLPFRLNEVTEIYQTKEDKRPEEKGNWEYWDD